jgi:hypothetical protein
MVRGVWGIAMKFAAKCVSVKVTEFEPRPNEAHFKPVKEFKGQKSAKFRVRVDSDKPLPFKVGEIYSIEIS